MAAGGFSPHSPEVPKQSPRTAVQTLAGQFRPHKFRCEPMRCSSNRAQHEPDSSSRSTKWQSGCRQGVVQAGLRQHKEVKPHRRKGLWHQASRSRLTFCNFGVVLAALPTVLHGGNGDGGRPLGPGGGSGGGGHGDGQPSGRNVMDVADQPDDHDAAEEALE